MQALVEKAVVLTKVGRGREIGKLSKLTDKVGLVEITAFHGDLRPIVSIRETMDDRPRLLKSLDPAKQLRCHADLGFEDLYETSLAEPDVAGHASYRCIYITPKHFEPARNSVVMLKRPVQVI